MLSRKCIINERSIDIPIKGNLSTMIKNDSPKGQYGLKQNCFDPSKSSPPNMFMMKLHMRMSIYDNVSTCHLDNNDNNFDNE
jgi:hypothetical protein